MVQRNVWELACRALERGILDLVSGEGFPVVDPQTEKIGDLPGGLLHFSVRSLDDLIRKCEERAKYNALHSKPKSALELNVRIITDLPR